MAPSRNVPSSSSDFKPVSVDGQSPSAFAGAAKDPKSKLAEYRLLAPKCGLRVSPVAIGAMSVGDQWQGHMGNAMDYGEAERYLDTYYELGGNFIDTANNYQDEQSEVIIGEWMEKRGIRDEIVLATKYACTPVNRVGKDFPGIQVNYAGNHKKSLKHSVESSLLKLRTDYIDLLYLHWWDYSTPVEEVMQSLNDLVKSGKVLYLGVSDTPAWIVAQANEYARAHGIAQFVVYQGNWSLASRDMERDVLPMCRANGMGVSPWGVMGGGHFKTPKELKDRGLSVRGGNGPSEDQKRVCHALQEVADEVGTGTHLAQIAMAWARQKYPYTFPIIGGVRIEQLKSNVESLAIELNTKQLEKLDQAASFNPGFPAAFFGSDPHYLPEGKPNGMLLNAAGNITFVNQP